jgi:hypothetical protein
LLRHSDFRALLDADPGARAALDGTRRARAALAALAADAKPSPCGSSPPTPLAAGA